MIDRIDEASLPLVDAAPTDEGRAVRNGKSIRFPLSSLPPSSAVQSQLDALADGQAAGQLVYRTWAELSAVTGSVGDGAQVISDAGTHTDPVVGGTVSNAGQYVWSASPAGWRWVRADALALKADKAALDVSNSYSRANTRIVDAAFIRGNVFDASAPDVAVGRVLSLTTGALSVNAGYTTTGFMRVVPGRQYTLSRGYYIAYYDENMQFVSSDPVAGVAPYTVTIPAGCYWMRASINLAGNNPATFMVAPGDNLPAAYVPYGSVSIDPDVIPGYADTQQAADTAVAALSDYVPTPITVVDGYYINRTTGAVAALASYRYTMLTHSPGDQWAISARVNGTGVALAVYYGAGDVYLGRELDGTTAVNDVVGYQLNPPAGTVKIGITGRVELPLVVKKLQIVDVVTTINDVAYPWAGKVIDVLGDSNVQQNKWQPLVSARMGCTFLNHGVGGSKVAKPDSNPTTQISMCDDVRVNALSASADAYIILGGTNDWAQSIPVGAMADTADTTFIGALKQVVAKMIARFPSKPIFLATIFPASFSGPRNGSWSDGETNAVGATTADYADAIRRVAARYAIPVIDLHSSVGFNVHNRSTYLLEESTSAPAGGFSYIHLTPGAGADRVAARVASAVSAERPE